MSRKGAIASLALVLLASGQVRAEGWTWVPSAEADFRTESTVSLMFGYMDIGAGIDNDFVTGIEWSFDSPFLRPPANRIRQQLSFTRYYREGIGINMIELNPHYIVEVSPDLEFGFGPGIGLVIFDAPNGEGEAFSVQGGTSIHYTGHESLFFGGQAIYQHIGSRRFGNFNDGDISNLRILFKAGYRF